MGFRLVSKILLAFLLVFVFAGLSAHSVLAHSRFDHSNPSPNSQLGSGSSPTQVQVWFSERLETRLSTLEVVNKDGQRVDSGDSRADGPFSLIVSIPPNLPDSGYTVSYKTVSEEDGHVATGSFTFAVGTGTQPLPPDLLDGRSTASDPNFDLWGASLHWLNYFTVSGLVGGLVFLLLVWQPATKQIKSEAFPQFVEVNLKLITRILKWNTGLLGFGWLAFLIFQACLVGNICPWQLLSHNIIPTLLFSSRWGVVWLIRFGLVVGAVAILFTSNKITNARLWVVLALGTGILLTTTLYSPAATSENANILIPAELAYRIGAGFWVGGLAYLVLLLVLGLKTFLPESGDRTRLLAILISNFSFVAILSLVVLLISGSFQAIFRQKSVTAIFEVASGESSLTKILLLIPLLALGAYHWLVVNPKIRQFPQLDGNRDKAEQAPTGSLPRIFRQALIIEFSVAVFVCILTSSAPNDPTGSAINLHQGRVGDLTYTLAVSPEKVGDNIFELQLKDSSNNPLENPDKVLLRFVNFDNEMEVGVQELELKPLANKPGRYAAAGNSLSMAGYWLVGLVLSRPGLADLKWQVNVEIQNPGFTPFFRGIEIFPPT